MSSSERVKIISPEADYDMPEDYYNAADSEHFWVDWRFRVLKSLLPRNFDWSRTLDVGCGNAVTAEQIESHYGSVIAGCEMNISLLSMAVAGSGPLYYYDITEKHDEFKDFFSNIIILDVLEHIEDPVRFLNAVNFHLKDNAKVIINVPAFQGFYSLYDKVQGHFKRYTVSLLEKELAAAGFYIDKAIYWGMSLAPIALIRKYIMRFCRRESAIKIGFRPPTVHINAVLKLIGKAETLFFKRSLFGTSLMAVARKGG